MSKTQAMVVTAFNEPLEMREYEKPAPRDGEVLVRLVASGVCGSDRHIWAGEDPRTPLPIILGHEGVGVVEETTKGRNDVFGSELKPGDAVYWNRGFVCGKCVYCTVKKQSSLCPNRKVYGISLSCADPPHLRGCYARHILLDARTDIFKYDRSSTDAASLVAAMCSGATAAHAVELAGITPGNSVVVIGCGSMGLFAIALAQRSGAARILGLETFDSRLPLAKRFGAAHAVNVTKTTVEERKELVTQITSGLGADVVIDTTGSPRVIHEGISLCARGGTYLLPGIAVPAGETPISFYEDVSIKNLRIQGVWVSDARHLYQAASLVIEGAYPFEELVTDRYPLEQAHDALMKSREQESNKVVIEPER